MAATKKNSNVTLILFYLYKLTTVSNFLAWNNIILLLISLVLLYTVTKDYFCMLLTLLLLPLLLLILLSHRCLKTTSESLKKRVFATTSWLCTSCWMRPWISDTRRPARQRYSESEWKRTRYTLIFTFKTHSIVLVSLFWSSVCVKYT